MNISGPNSRFRCPAIHSLRANCRCRRRRKTLTTHYRFLIILQTKPSDEDDSLTDKLARLCDLIDIPSVPSREALIADMKARGILQLVHPELAELFTWLEEEFHPLRLGERVEPILKWLSSTEKFAHFAGPIRNIVLMRLLKQVCKYFVIYPREWQ